MNPVEPNRVRRLHSPPASTLLRNLSDVGDGLAGQIAALQRDPTSAGCELLKINLHGAARMVMQISGGLEADVELARDRD